MTDVMKAECTDKMSLGVYDIMMSNNQRLNSIASEFQQSIDLVRTQKPL